MPIVSCLPRMRATASLVPTPSVAERMTGSRRPFGKRVAAANSPTPEQHVRGACGGRDFLDPLDQTIGRRDVDAGLTIRES